MSDTVSLKKTSRGLIMSCLRLALPIALSNLLTFGIGISSSLMSGPLGEAAVSGAHLAIQIQNLVQIFLTGIEAAVLILSAKALGNNNQSEAMACVSSALKISVFFTFLLTIVCIFFGNFIISLFISDEEIIKIGGEYLKIISFSFVPYAISGVLISAMRAEEKCSLGIFASGAALIINTALGYVLIFDPLGISPPGISGGAIATVAARAAELIVVLIYVFKQSREQHRRLSDILCGGVAELRKFLSRSLPIISTGIVWMINTLFSSFVFSSLGENALSAISVATVANSLIFTVINALSSGVGIVTAGGSYRSPGTNSGSIASDREAMPLRDGSAPLGDNPKRKGTPSSSKGQRAFGGGSGIRSIFADASAGLQLLGIGVGAGLSLLLLFLRLPLLSFYNIGGEGRSASSLCLICLALITPFISYQAVCLFGILKSGGYEKFVFRLDAILVALVVIPAGLLALRLNAPPWLAYLCLRSDQLIKCPIALIKLRSTKQPRQKGKSTFNNYI